MTVHGLFMRCIRLKSDLLHFPEWPLGRRKELQDLSIERNRKSEEFLFAHKRNTLHSNTFHFKDDTNRE